MQAVICYLPKKREKMTQKKEPSAAQLAARKKFGEQAKARAAAKKEQVTAEPAPHKEEIAPESSVEDLKRQIDELKAYLFNQNQQSAPQGPQVNQSGVLKGTFEKYLVDPDNYPDPTERLASEERLAQFAFGHNYNLSFETAISTYETKDGVNVKEPRFHITLSRKRYDDQGNPVVGENGDQLAYVIRNLTYHEDPQTALIMAREQKLDIDQSNEKRFLDEMRYLRARDWLFDVFFPKGSDTSKNQSQEVIDGKLVQIISISSKSAQGIPFAELR